MAGESPAVTNSDRSILLADPSGLTKRARADDDGNLLVAVAAEGVDAPLSPVANAAVSSFAASVLNQVLAVSNPDRKGFYIYNKSDSNLYVKFGIFATTSDFSICVFPFSLYECPLPVYVGRLDGVWDVAVGSAHLTELT